VVSNLIPPPPPPDRDASGYVPAGAGNLPRRERPGPVTAVVVISYVQAVLGLLVAAAFSVLGEFVLGVVVAAFSILVGFMAYRIGRGSRGWRTAFMVINGIAAVLDLLLAFRNLGLLIGMAIGILCMVLLSLQSSRAWFNATP